MTNFIDQYIEESREVAGRLDRDAIEKMIQQLVEIRREKGRLFFLGVGGSAGNASHAVNDFRKICGFEAYSPTDNVSELTARINDDGWDTSFANWLLGSRLTNKDAIFVFSVGGGDIGKNVSMNLVRAVEYTKTVGAKVLGIVGRQGGFTAKHADACIIVPTVNPHTVTAHTESFQVLIWHMLISDPRLQQNAMKWEAIDRPQR